MNILMLGRWLPLPRHSVRTRREYHFARYLARTHRLTLGFITDNPDSGGTIAALRKEFGDLEFAEVARGWKSLSSAVRLATGESCTLSYFRSSALRTRLADRLRRGQYDVVLVSASSMIQYAMDVDPSIPIVVDFGEVDSEWWIHQARRATFGGGRFFRAEAARLRAVEAAVARRAARCVVATPAAAGIVETMGTTAPVTLIPTGVDMDAFAGTLRAGKVPTLVLNTCFANAAEIQEVVEFCRAIIPAVRAQVPEARFVVCSRDSAVLEEVGWPLAEVELVAPVSDLRLLLHTRAVAVAPMRSGSDVQTSVLEPMAAGIPVIASSQVCHQMGARAGCDLQVGEGSRDFALQVVELLQNDALREGMGAKGRCFVRANYSWEAFVPRLDGVLAGISGRGVESERGPERTPMPAASGD